ncbi:MAG: GDSL family lipase [Erysipelotrichaceae bacterium]|nr:GDSL family lipase [Erysipelotrichaceae bacterium]
MRIVCYGDSNTWGFNPLTGKRYEKPYPVLLRELFPDDEIISEGLNGRTMVYDDPFDKDRNAKKDIQRLIKTHLPIDVLIIMLGTNDAKRIFSTNPTSLQKGMRALIYQVLDADLYRSGFAMPKILVVRPPRMHPLYYKNAETNMTFGEPGYQMLEQAGEALSAIPTMFKDAGVDYLDTGDICMAQAYDGIHMDAENHANLAQALEKRIRSYQ